MTSSENGNVLINGGFGPCSNLYERFTDCMSFGGQLRRIHREGIAENCGDLITDYSRCLMAQSSHDETKKKEIFENSNMFRLKVVRPENDILIRKEKPSWE